MRTLAIDTSTPRASLALNVDGALIWSTELSCERTHSSALFPALETARDQVGRFDRIVVGLGPGSYAGVRIAIAAALGMRAAWECELLGVSSVLGVAAPGSDYCGIGDARRGSWYFTEVRDGRCVVGPMLAGGEEEVVARVRDCGLPIYATEAVSISGLAVEVRFPEARFLSEIAEGGREESLFRGPLEPLYLREAYITRPRAGNRGAGR